MRFLLPYCLHQSAEGTAPDADGTLRTGRDRPQFDTMIMISNPHAFDCVARFNFYQQDGTPAPFGDGSQFYDYRLQADQSVAMTLIPNNPFPDPPSDFIGHAMIDLLPLTPFSKHPDECVVRACLGGGGFWPTHWNTFCADVPVIKGEVPAKDIWRSPYAISFRDKNHTDYAYREKRINLETGEEEAEGRVIHRDFSYCSGLVITNFDTVSADVRVRYKVGQPYVSGWQERFPNVPIEFAFETTIPKGNTFVQDFFGRLENLGYPPDASSEGFVEIKSLSGLVRLAPYLLISSRNYDIFSFGIGFE